MDVQLREELKKPAYNGKTDAEVLTMLNASVTKTKKVSIEDIETYLFENGLFDAILQTGKAQNENAETIAAKAVTQIFTSKKTTIDVNHAVFQAGLTALVNASKITQPQADAITALGDDTTTIAKQIGTRLPVRLGYITTARA